MHKKETLQKLDRWAVHESDLVEISYVRDGVAIDLKLAQQVCQQLSSQIDTVSCKGVLRKTNSTGIRAACASAVETCDMVQTRTKVNSI